MLHVSVRDGTLYDWWNLSVIKISLESVSENLKTNLQSRRGSAFFRISLWLSLGITLCHVLSLHLEISFDGNWYVHLADILGTNKFPAEWDFLRGPLYPAALKFMFWLCGRQAMAVIGLHACLAYAAIYLLARRVRSLNRPIEASVAAVLLSLYPTLIVYQHALFTEVGTFLFLSFFVCFLTRVKPPDITGAMVLCAALSAGYYYRSSLLYLAPLIGILYAWPAFRFFRDADSRWKNHHISQAVVMIFLVAVVPFVFAYPWQRNPLVSTRTGQAVILFGLVKSSVLPTDDPILGPTAPIYRKAIQQSTLHGKFPAHGLENGSEWSVIDPIYGLGSSAVPIFIRVVRTHPIRYLEGVGRNLLLVSGLSGFRNDNAYLRDIVLSPNRSEIDPGPPWLPPLGNEWRRTTVVSFTSRVLEKLDRLYNWILLVGSFATAIGLIGALIRQDTIVLTFTTVPVAFLLIHVAFLMSEDRMALPAYPMLLLNALLLPAWTTRLLRKRSS
jgi:hypothetical protein